MKKNHILYNLFFLVIALILLLAVNGCVGSELSVNGQKITDSYVTYRILLKQDMHSSEDEITLTSEEAMKIKNKIIEEILLVQHAKKEGITIDQKRTKEVLNKMIASFDSKKEFLEELKKEDITEEDILLEIENHLYLESLQKNMIKKIKITNSEIEKFYQENTKDYLNETIYHFQIISTETKADAEEAEGFFEKSKDFGETAKKFSESQSSDLNGDEGWLPESEIILPVRDELSEIDIGEVSSFMQTDWGYLKVKLLEKVPSTTKPLSEVEPDIKKRLINNKYQDDKMTLVKELKEQAEIKGLD